MTKSEIRETIEKARMTQEEKNVMQRECDNGNPDMLFCVRALAIRQRNQRPMMIKGKIRMAYYHPIQDQ